ncbi:MAG: hypothetical protein ACLQNV_05415, partial [Steroidobacteraceae bacterium]
MAVCVYDFDFPPVHDCDPTARTVCHGKYTPVIPNPPLGLINNCGMHQERPPEHLSPLRSVQNRKQINKTDSAHHSLR